MNIDELLIEVTRRKASDLHLTVGMPPIIRENGLLKQLKRAKISRDDTEELVSKILREDQQETFKAKGEVDFSYSVPDVGLFRVNAYRQRGSVGIAFRILNTRVFTLEELKLPETVQSMARRNRGLILVTGPTGSGKSTTLAAMTDLINSEKSYHIITLEDPIEYIHKHKKSIITQREIGRDSTTFASALRAALRQDPDVILVGEMRDLETISIAVTAAETGHLVLATLHTNDAAQSVERIVDSFPPNQQFQIRTQLANSLIGVISQRLIPSKDGSGRVVAAEIMLCNNAVRNLIREGKVHQITSIMQVGSKQGMLTMDKHLQMLYEDGVITEEVLQEYSRDELGMLAYLEKRNGGSRK